MTPEQQAITLAFRRMLKEHTYWGLVHIRYGIESNWQEYRTQLHQQVLGRHQDREICQLITADLPALSTFLGDRPYFMNNQPTTLDATVYAHIGNLIHPSFESAIVDAARNLTNLCQHCDRIAQSFSLTYSIVSTFNGVIGDDRPKVS